MFVFLNPPPLTQLLPLPPVSADTIYGLDSKCVSRRHTAVEQLFFKFLCYHSVAVFVLPFFPLALGLLVVRCQSPDVWWPVLGTRATGLMSHTIKTGGGSHDGA